MTVSDKWNHSSVSRPNGSRLATPAPGRTATPLPCEPPANGLFTKAEWAFLLESLSLSGRQAEILRNLLAGMTDKQIARELQISIPTVRTHLRLLGSKLDTTGRLEILVAVFVHFRELTGDISRKETRRPFEGVEVA
ncbi:MAG: helix-turn-helix transcriptional regulator [Planctomycetota bacterium]